MNDDTITAFAILNAKIQTELINHIEHVRNSLNEAFQHHVTGIYNMGAPISGAYEPLTDFLLERDSYHDRDSRRQEDIFAASVILIAQAPGPQNHLQAFVISHDHINRERNKDPIQ